MTGVISEESKGARQQPLSPSTTTEGLTVMVVDGTWRKARKMAKHLDTVIPGGLCHVALSPNVLSVYRRRQSQPGRICTIEAVAMLLEEAGESAETHDVLVDLVRLNNAALNHDEVGGAAARSKKDLYRPCGGHPAWYYGRQTT